MFIIDAMTSSQTRMAEFQTSKTDCRLDGSAFEAKLLVLFRVPCLSAAHRGSSPKNIQEHLWYEHGPTPMNLEPTWNTAQRFTLLFFLPEQTCSFSAPWIAADLWT